jgi:hypothetical protein
MRCPACSTENEDGRKFCGECGRVLALVCPVCGASNGPGSKFCGECGAPLEALPAEPAPSAPAQSAERRLVSVLFADLVGFTTLSEARDSEEVGERLTHLDRYEDSIGTHRAGLALARRIGNRYWEWAFLGLLYPYLVVAQLEHGEWLLSQGRADEPEPLLTEAREIFERLEAAPWVRRAAAAEPADVVA